LLSALTRSTFFFFFFLLLSLFLSLVLVLLLLLLLLLVIVAVVVPVIARVRILVRHRVLAVLIRPEVVSERRLAPDVDLMMRYAATS
jgi:hypothetical protein